MNGYVQMVPITFSSRQFRIYEVYLAEALTSWAPVFWVRCAFVSVWICRTTTPSPLSPHYTDFSLPPPHLKPNIPSINKIPHKSSINELHIFGGGYPLVVKYANMAIFHEAFFAFD